MLKSDLRGSGLNERTIEPKHSGINRLWVILTLLLIIMSFILVSFVVENFMGNVRMEDRGEHDDIFMTIVNSVIAAIGQYIGADGATVAFFLMFLIFSLIAYLFLKCLIMAVSCHKGNSIRMKILKDTKVPVCLCTEALKVWQMVLVHTAPFVLTYSLFIFLCIRYTANPVFTLTLVFLLFYMALDLTLVIYVLRFKMRETIDYISSEQHVYMLTLFSKTYIRARKKSRRKRRTGWR